MWVERPHDRAVHLHHRKTYLVPTTGLLALLGLPVPGGLDDLTVKELRRSST